MRSTERERCSTSRLYKSRSFVNLLSHCGGEDYPQVWHCKRDAIIPDHMLFNVVILRW